MLSHISFGCTDLRRSTAFYETVLSTLGYVRVWSNETASGFAPAGQEDVFAIKLQAKVTPPGPGFHLAFSACSRFSVDEFHRRALELGAQDKGKPGLRTQYGPDYYAAFLLDLDGFYIEAVYKGLGENQVPAH
ncbi:MAG TPA: VOC family protein [Bacteriovoracaceae bacterium]|nr:VOC family protein [Bacteriovoracaceae bacterium]